MLRIIILGLSACLLYACSGEESAQQENVFQYQADSLKKAQEVEGQLLESDRRQREQLKEAE